MRIEESEHVDSGSQMEGGSDAQKSNRDLDGIIPPSQRPRGCVLASVRSRGSRVGRGDVCRDGNQFLPGTRYETREHTH